MGGKALEDQHVFMYNANAYISSLHVVEAEQLLPTDSIVFLGFVFFKLATDLSVRTKQRHSKNKQKQLIQTSGKEWTRIHTQFPHISYFWRHITHFTQLHNLNLTIPANPAQVLQSSRVFCPAGQITALTWNPCSRGAQTLTLPLSQTQL